MNETEITKSDPRPVGVFDSGVGGLTVAREIIRNLPKEEIIYYGDTARLPYGNKSAETVIRYSLQITRFLESNDVKAIVIACNTASALALDAVKEAASVPVIGVVEPGALAACEVTKTRRIGVIGTTATISSGLYDAHIKKISPEAKVFSKACPLFVSLVEEGMTDDPITRQMIHRYLDEMVAKDNIDALILGCTHYPLLRSVIGEEINAAARGISLVNPAYETALALKRLLESKGISNAQGAEATLSSHKFFVSDAAKKFREFAGAALEMDIEHIQTKVLE